MYDPIDIHGFSRNTADIVSYTYNPTQWYDKYKELEEKYKKLEKKLKMYEDLKQDNNINLIDGKICYRELKDASVDAIEMDDDYSGFRAFISGQIVYKDIDTDEVMAIRNIEGKAVTEDNEECTRL